MPVFYTRIHLVKRYRKVLPLHAIKAPGGVEVQLRSFVTSTKERASVQILVSACLTAVERSLYLRGVNSNWGIAHTEPDLAAHCVKRPRTHKRRLPVHLNRLFRKGNMPAFQTLVKFPFLYSGSLKTMCTL